MTSVTKTLKNLTPRDMHHSELEPGYYHTRYVGQDLIVLVTQTATEGKVAFSLDDPEGLYWTEPFRLTVVNPITKLHVEVLE